MIAYVRELRASEGFLPNERFCLNGQDADMIMLALSTHEPFFHVLREKIEFRSPIKKKKSTAKGLSLSCSTSFVFTLVVTLSFFCTDKTLGGGPKLEYLKIHVLREQLTRELSEGCEAEVNKERLIDDFVFLTFLVGNDFLPHLPSLRIGDSAFDIIFEAYKTSRVGSGG